MEQATLTFATIQMAKKFASAWAMQFLEGNDMTKVQEDGSVSVTVYNVDDHRKEWITAYVMGV